MKPEDSIKSEMQRVQEESRANKILEELGIRQLLDAPAIERHNLDVAVKDERLFYGTLIKGVHVLVDSEGNVYKESYECLDCGNTLIPVNGKVPSKCSCGRKGQLIHHFFQELFQPEARLGEIAPLISNLAIKRWLTKEKGEKVSNPKALYKEIRDLVLFFMDFAGKDEIADVITCWILATYVYPIFYWFPGILINAPRDSGKSKCSKIILRLSFRGFDLGASGGVSPAQLFRTLEGNRGTIGLDELEKQDSKVNDIGQQLLWQVINAGADREAYVIRMEKDESGKWVSKKFYVYAPKLVSNISGINPTSLSRFIALTWLKTSNQDKARRKVNSEIHRTTFSRLRDDCYLFGLENWKTIKAFYEQMPSLGLVARDDDNWMPLFSIARFIDTCEGEQLNAEEGLKQFLKDYNELSFQGNDTNADFFYRLLEQAPKAEEWYQAKEIAEMPEIAELLTAYKGPGPAQWVGKRLRSYKFPDNKRSGGVMKFKLSKALVSRVIELYFNTQKTTQENTDHTIIHSIYNITQHNTNHTDVLSRAVLCGGGDEKKAKIKALIDDLLLKHASLDIQVLKINLAIHEQLKGTDFEEVFTSVIEHSKGSGEWIELPAGVLRRAS